eukprot:1183719-Prorocentrum_minimum.AAC.11
MTRLYETDDMVLKDPDRFVKLAFCFLAMAACCNCFSSALKTELAKSESHQQIYNQHQSEEAGEKRGQNSDAHHVASDAAQEAVASTDVLFNAVVFASHTIRGRLLGDSRRPDVKSETAVTLGFEPPPEHQAILAILLHAALLRTHEVTSAILDAGVRTSTNMADEENDEENESVSIAPTSRVGGC